MGPPANRIKLAGGDTVLQYPRGSAARETFAVRIGPDGVVREVSQIRTIENVGKIKIGGSSADDVRAILGPPDRVTPMRNLQRAKSEGKRLLLAVEVVLSRVRDLYRLSND